MSEGESRGGSSVATASSGSGDGRDTAETSGTTADAAAVGRTASNSGGWGSRAFRGDVDGLRAVAIVLVVLFHSGLPFFAGGFVGVDVFFAISGYLITRNLITEGLRRGQVSLANFWAKRVRRLVPALGLTVVATLIAAALILPSFDLARVATQGAAAALYLSNLLFARDSQDYFADDLSTSPFLHTWSLGVEEQFYLVWPVLFAGLCWFAGRRARTRVDRSERLRTAMIVVFSVIGALSLAASVVLSPDNRGFSFYLLPTRAWEFALAGLVAIGVHHRRVPAVLSHVLAFGGVALILGSAHFFRGSMAYPGFWALIPVLATLGVVIAGDPATFPDTNPLSRVLATGPAQWLGRVSYSWYLWHWPFIVLAAELMDDDGIGVKLPAAFLALPVGWLAYRYFENPVRFAKPLVRSRPATFAMAGTVTLALVVGATALGKINETDTTVVAGPNTAGLSMEERVNIVRAQYIERGQEGCADGNRRRTDAGDGYCLGGDLTATKSVMLIGDSHSGQWRDPLGVVAAKAGVKVIARQRNGCPAIPVSVAEKDGSHKKVCDEIHVGDGRLLDELKPDAVIVAQWSGNVDWILEPDGTKPSVERQVQIWEEGTRTFVRDLRKRGIAVGFILDEPSLPEPPHKCLIANGRTEPCESTRDVALARTKDLRAAEDRVIAEDAKVATFDLTPLICDATRCRLEVDGNLVYVDSHHLSEEFVDARGPELARLLQQTMKGAGA